MRDFRLEIDRCTDFAVLSELLEEISIEIDRAYDESYEEDSLLTYVHDLELLMRYGEYKLGQMLE
jgi:hypothetical protein